MNKSCLKRIIATSAVILCTITANLGSNIAYFNNFKSAKTASNNIEYSESEACGLYSSTENKSPILNDDLYSKLDKPIKDFPLIKDPVFDFPGGLIPSFRPEESTEPLPETYCMRDEYLTFAQHQDKNGLCWNFAATMAASTTIMKATNEYYDFSELWTAITCYTPKKQYSKIGAGGSFSYQQKAMQRNGLMLESDLPYQHAYTVSNENATDYFNYYNQYANDDLAGTLIADSTTSFSKSKVDAIKRHLLNHGSLYLAFSFRTGFLEENGVYSLTPNQKNTNSNHAISLIGWDDNYKKEFYLDGSTTPTKFKGAWIVLNSYTETNGTDGISLIFYNDNNIYDIRGYRYQKDTNKALYFYDKIEKGYEYPINLKGKYYGSLTAQTANTKQLNVFYNDVNLEYSYEISAGAKVTDIDIYLDNKDVTSDFSVRIDEKLKRFYIEKQNAKYGNYKVLVRYANAQTADTYLNNFFVTHGLIGEELEFDHENNSFAFATGKDLEYYSFNTSNKNHVIYTNTLSGDLSLIASAQSVYSEKSLSIPTLHYEITDGKSCTVTHTVTANTGYELKYNFTFIYCEDTSMQPVRVYYDLGGGTNNEQNYAVELASESGGLTLYAPTRDGYDFKGWYVDGEEGPINATNVENSYVINWNNIHHMGASPTLYALNYYKQHYNNTNVLFVHAVWEKTPEIVEPEITQPQGMNGLTLGLIISLSAVSASSVTALIILLVKMRKATSLTKFL